MGWIVQIGNKFRRQVAFFDGCSSGSRGKKSFLLLGSKYNKEFSQQQQQQQQ